MFVTYKLSEKSLNKLQKKGISEAALNDLAEMENLVFSSQETFLGRVRKLSQAKEIMEKEDDLLKAASGVAFSPIPYLIYGYSGLYLFIMIFGVDLVMVFLGIRLFLKPSQSNCAMIQKWMKWNIFVGLLAVCLGKPSRLLPIGV